MPRKRSSKSSKIKSNMSKTVEKSNFILTKFNMNPINLIFITFLNLVSLEFLFKWLVFGFSSIFKINNLFLLIFLFPVSGIIVFISHITKSSKKNKIIYFLILGLLTIWYAIALIFKKVFNTYFCLSLFGLSDQAIAFSQTAIIEILKNIIPLLILFLPFILSFLYSKYFDFSKPNNKKSIINLLTILLSIIVLNIVTYQTKDKENSLYSKFHGLNNNALNVETIGVLPAFYLDFKDIVMNNHKDIEIEIPSIDEDNNQNEEEKPNEENYSYNILDIDFDNLVSSEKNKTLLNMHKYLKSDKGTLKNEYTGLFKDKNLIVITAESLNSIGIRADVTPTLYKLATEGFNFTNFYTPINLSTIGGEFQNLTGLFANLNDLNKYFRKGTNYFPFGLGTTFKNSGYDVKAYHANDAYFQDRNVYLKNMGFNYFKAKNTGLEKLMDCNKWPQSDEEMLNVTIPEYLNSDKFLTYYVSVSSHMPYSKNGNAIVNKNWSLVKNLDYSEEAKGYLASVIELDKAVSSLIKSLEENNKLDDTVIAIIPDHYPYSLSLNAINELSDYKRDDTIEVNHNTLIIWNTKTPGVTINKTASQLDFLPTIYNLFNIAYDSRLFMGKDILSSELGLVYFQNKSWVSDKGTYLASQDKFIPKDGVSVDDEYVDNINKTIANRMRLSKLIIENDYYAKVIKN